MYVEDIFVDKLWCQKKNETGRCFLGQKKLHKEEQIYSCWIIMQIHSGSKNS